MHWFSVGGDGFSAEIGDIDIAGVIVIGGEIAEIAMGDFIR